MSRWSRYICQCSTYTFSFRQSVVVAGDNHRFVSVGRYLFLKKWSYFQSNEAYPFLKTFVSQLSPYISFEITDLNLLVISKLSTTGHYQRIQNVDGTYHHDHRAHLLHASYRCHVSLQTRSIMHALFVVNMTTSLLQHEVIYIPLQTQNIIHALFVVTIPTSILQYKVLTLFHFCFLFCFVLYSFLEQVATV